MMAALGNRLEVHFSVYYASDKRSKLLRLWAMCLAIWRHRRQADYVLIDVYSSLNFWYAWVAARLCRWFRLPYIAYLHGGNLPARLEHWPKACSAIFSHSAANVAPSTYLQTAFQQKGFKVKVIPNFINLRDYPFPLRQTCAPRLLWVRAFEKTYNPEMAVQVLAALAKTNPDARLCMVGADKDGSLLQCQQLAAALGVAAQIEFPGQLAKTAWISRANTCDIFLNTTHFDNTPVSVLEAMALGLPVVSTDAGGMPFLLEQGKDGLLSPVGDVGAMVKNIQHLLDDSLSAAMMRQHARQKVEQFDGDRVIGLWLKLLS